MLPATAFNGKQSIPFSFPPLIVHDVQLVPQGNARIWLNESKLVGPAAPELVTLWEPQPTSHGIQGYQTVREIRPVVQGNGECAIAAACEFGSFSVKVALTGAVEKLYLPAPTNKSMLYGWKITAPGGVRVFSDDFEVLLKPWGGESFQSVHPFGESGTGGALI